MKKILLPTDFSDNSWNAIAYALELFKNEKCTFFLLNNYYPAIYGVEFMEVYSAKSGLIDAALESSKERLEALHQKIKKQFRNPNHTFSKISSMNTLVREIEELQMGNVINYIVMGTKGATGFKEILFGSNTVHVIKNAKCPVLAIPSNFKYEYPHEVLFPSDFNIPFTDKLIEPIIDISKSHYARINILHIANHSGLSEEQEINKQKLDTYFKKVAHIFHSEENDNVLESITNFQLKANIKLMVMINNKNSFFEKLFFKSIINQIGFHLNFPFLVVPF